MPSLDTKISGLAGAAALTGAEFLVAVQGAQTVKTTLWDIVYFQGSTRSPEYYGAIADGVFDSYTAIQACIDANPGRAIFFKGGVYAYTQVPRITHDNTSLVGVGQSATYFRQDGVNLDVLQIKCQSTATKTSFVSGTGFQGIEFFRNSASTSGAVRITQSNGGDFKDFVCSNIPGGVIVEGGQLNSIHNFRLFVSGSQFNLAGTVNSALLSFHTAPIDGDQFQIPFTTNVYGFHMASNKAMENNIHIAAADGLNFSQFYCAGSFTNLVKVEGLQHGTRVAAVSFGDGYFDGVNQSTGTQFVLSIPDDGFDDSFVYSVTIDGCTMGNTQQGGVIARKKKLSRLNIDNNELINFTTWPMDIDCGADLTEVSFGNNNINGFATGGPAGAIRIGNVRLFSWSGGTVVNGATGGAALVTFGTIGTLSVGNLGISNTSSDWGNSATIGRFASTGNTSDNVDPTSSLCGLRTGNYDVTDPTCLDIYFESTFTPAVAIGAGAPASYAAGANAPAGTYTRVGNRCNFDIDLALASKGAATGAILVTGLPVLSSSARNTPVSLRMSRVTSGVGDTALMGCVLAGTNTVRIDKMVAGSLVQLTEADLQDTTFIQISGSYRT